MEAQVLLLQESTEIEAYNEFRSQLKELQEINDNTYFNYSDRKGNTEARSHIARLRKTKTAIESKRVELKAESLETGRKIDKEAKAIKDIVDSMINKHLIPIQEIEKAEEDRISALKARVAELQPALPVPGDSTVLRMLLESVEAMVIDESFKELRLTAVETKKSSVEVLRAALAAVEKLEKEQAEFDKLRKEQEERERREYEAKIIQDATDRVRQEERKLAEERTAIRDEEIRQEERTKAQIVIKAETVAVNNEISGRLVPRDAPIAISTPLAISNVEEEKTLVERNIHHDIRVYLNKTGEKLSLDTIIDAVIAGQVRNMKIVWG